MKKLILSLSIMSLITFGLYSCRETTGEKAEDAVEAAAEDTKDNIETAGDAIEEAAEDTGDAIENAGDEINEEIEGTDDMQQTNDN